MDISRETYAKQLVRTSNALLLMANEGKQVKGQSSAIAGDGLRQLPKLVEILKLNKPAGDWWTRIVEPAIEAREHFSMFKCLTLTAFYSNSIEQARANFRGFRTEVLILKAEEALSDFYLDKDTFDSFYNAFGALVDYLYEFWLKQRRDPRRDRHRQFALERLDDMLQEFWLQGSLEGYDLSTPKTYNYELPSGVTS